MTRMRTPKTNATKTNATGSRPRAVAAAAAAAVAATSTSGDGGGPGVRKSRQTQAIVETRRKVRAAACVDFETSETKCVCGLEWKQLDWTRGNTTGYEEQDEERRLRDAAGAWV